MRPDRALVLCAATAAWLGGTAELYAQIPTGQTYLEFISPTRIPGATLAPGMYLFVTGRPVGDQAIIDIYAADGSRLIATCLAIETRLPRDGRATAIAYDGGEPAALRAWFPAGHRSGVEFVYPPAEAREISADAGVSVPSAAFRSPARDLVGAFVVSNVGVDAAPAAPERGPAVVGTAGTMPAGGWPIASPGPHEHLFAARRLLADRAAASPHERVLLETLERYVSRLQRACRQNDARGIEVALRAVDRSLDNLLPDEQRILERRQERLPRETVLVLERVRAHVSAAINPRPPSLP